MCTNHLRHVFSWVHACLLKVFCLIKVGSQFMQEKTTVFIFSLYVVIPVCINSWSARKMHFLKVRIKYVCVKGLSLIIRGII